MTGLITRKVIALFVSPDGSPIANARAVVRLADVDMSGTRFIGPRFYDQLTNSEGRVEFELWPNSLGQTGSCYEITVYHPETGRLILNREQFVVGDVDANLRDLINLPKVLGTDPVAVVLSQANAIVDEAREISAGIPALASQCVDAKAAAEAASALAQNALSKTELAKAVAQQAGDSANDALSDMSVLSGSIASELGLRLAPAIADAVVLGGEQYNGWVLRVRLHEWSVGGTYNISPDIARNIRLTVYGDGFSDAGAPIRVDRDVIGTVVVRRPYPDQMAADERAAGGDVELLVSLSDYIYQHEEVYVSSSNSWAENSAGTERATIGSTMMKVANESTLHYPEVIAKWSIPPYQEVSDTVHLECVAAHAYAGNKGMLAAVRFELTGRTSGITKHAVVSEMTISNWRNDQNPVQVYQTDIATTGFTQGEMIDARFIAYPKVGTASSVRDTANQVFPSIQLPANLPLKLSDGSAQPYAYVDSVSGNDGSGVVSSVASTAAAAPYATIKAAAAGIESFNNRGHLGSAEIRLMAGDHAGFGSALTSLSPGDSWLTITRDPGSARSLVNFTGGTNDDICDRVRVHDITLKPTSADAILFDGTDATEPSTALWLDDVSVVGDGTDLPLAYRVGYVYVTALSATDAGAYLLRGFSTTPVNNVLTRGVNTDDSGNIVSHCLIGCNWKGGLVAEDVPGTNREYQDGGIVAFNKGMSIDGDGLRIGWQSNAIGRAIFGNVFECIQTIQPCWSISADGNEIPIKNVLMFNNTVLGARTNVCYNDSGSDSVLKHLIFSRANIIVEWNHKDDVFSHPTDGQQSGRVGGWAVGYKVGFLGDLVLQGDSAGRTVASHESWLGEYIGRSCAVGSATFLDDKSTNLGGSGQGDGDYRLGAMGDVMRVPLKWSALPYDLAGIERNSDISAAGAYEYKV